MTMPHRLRRAIGAIVATAMLGSGLAAVQPAQADTQPPAAGVPETVAADALPTWQLTGVVWSQVVVGNTVYATGNFTRARPPGHWSGGPQEITVGHLFAYDIRTGERIASFNHTLNAQGLAITASPDGSRVYVGGDFTTVDDQVRQHVAAFDTATGALVAGWSPVANGQVKAISATNDTVYVGGAFESAGGQPRKRLASFSAASGTLNAWAPTADDGYVWSLVVAPDRSKVVVGGQFSTLNTLAVYGMGAVDPITGAGLPWAANAVIKDSGKGAINSLTTDGSYIYGTGYAFGTGGRFEGSFSLNPADGSIRWLVDCLGDTYDVEPVGDVAYTVSHAHNCTMIGGFPDTSPRTRWQHANAYTNFPTGVNGGPNAYGWNYKDQPAPKLLHFYPDLGIGTATGQYQAAWSVASSGAYVAMAGEFPTVNGKAQSGLTRFALKGTAQNKVGPTYLDTIPVRSTVPPTVATSVSPGTVRIGFASAWDFDNERLTYQVYRDRGTADEALVKTVTTNSNFWTVPAQYATDSNVPAGNHTYQVRVTDPYGNELLSPVSEPVSATDTRSPYAAQVSLDGADHYWRLGESGTTVYDSVGAADGTAQSGVSRGAGGAIGADTDKAASFSGTSSGYVGLGSSSVQAPDSFTLEGWFKTTTTSGGKIAGYGSAATSSSSSYDRHVYMSNNGRINFGVNRSGVKVLTTPTAYNDGQWHHFAASLSADGTGLLMDGRLIARDRTVTSGQSYKGYWRIGGDTLSTSWPNAPTSGYFNGTIDDVATYPSTLTVAQVNDHYVRSGRVSTVPGTAPSDPYGAATYAGGPDLYWRLNEASGPVAADLTSNDDRGIYYGSLSYGQPGGLAETSDKSVGFSSSSTFLSSASNFYGRRPTPKRCGFKTSTIRGGKLLGFGSSATGTSASIDRNLTMTNAGRLRFGVLNGATQVVVESPQSYNNNQWHHAVASQSPEGMRLYVDGVLVGTDPNRVSSSFTGYWRVGQDAVWAGSSNTNFVGLLDEVAVYSRALTLAEITSRYRKGGGTVGNTPPSASFTFDAAGLNTSFSGVTSTDPDGSIVSYAWNWGDGSTGTGPTAAHTFGAAGSYTVTLTVTDNQGAAHSASQAVTVANAAPVAGFEVTSSQRTVTTDAAGSADSDGTVATYAWNWGDDTAAGSGRGATHSYAADGDYTITLTVTDNAGGTATTSRQVSVAATQPPVSSFTVDVTGLKVAFDGTGSTDPDGTVAGYAWDFGDGSVSAAAQPNHTYAAEGTYEVMLTVTDDQGATGTRTVPLAVANGAPTAAFTSSAQDLAVAFDARGSGDVDGTIASYAWDFGDQSTAGSGATPDHTYAAGGTYEVRMTVTDNLGATATTTHTITVTPPNVKPTAAFTSSANELTVNFDAGGSSDADGDVASYAWDFGDGSAAGSGRTPGHDFPASGTYQVRLTVTDDDGATDSVTKAVTVTGPIARDGFSRTSATGWGNAEVGGPWTYSGSTSLFTVDGGKGQIKMSAAGSGPAARLGVSSTDTDLQFTFTFDKAPTGGGQFVRGIARGDQTNGYGSKVWVAANGTVTVYLTRVVNGTETDLGSRVLTGTFTAGTSYAVRTQVWGTGTTNLRAKAWRSDTTEPSTWSVTGTDSTAGLQGAGGIAVRAYLSGSATSAPVTLLLDNLRAVLTGN